MAIQVHRLKVVLKSYREGPWRRSRELSGLRDAAALAPPVLERVIGCRGLAHLTAAPPAVGRVGIGTTLVTMPNSAEKRLRVSGWCNARRVVVQ